MVDLSSSSNADWKKAREIEVAEAVSKDDSAALRRFASAPGGFGTDEARRKAWMHLLHSDSGKHPHIISEPPVPVVDVEETEKTENTESNQPHSASSLTIVEYTSSVHPDEQQILLDTRRSFVSYPADISSSQKAALQQELHALMIELFRRQTFIEGKLGYFQGLHDILTVFYLTFLGLPWDGQDHNGEASNSNDVREKLRRIAQEVQPSSDGPLNDTASSEASSKAPDATRSRSRSPRPSPSESRSASRDRGNGRRSRSSSIRMSLSSELGFMQIPPSQSTESSVFSSGAATPATSNVQANTDTGSEQESKAGEDVVVKNGIQHDTSVSALQGDRLSRESSRSARSRSLHHLTPRPHSRSPSVMASNSVHRQESAEWKALVDLLETFCLLRIRDGLTKSLEPMVVYLRLVKRIIKAEDPEFALIINRVSSIPFFALSWLLTLFAHDLDTFEPIQRIFDWVICRNPGSILYLGVAILLTKRSRAMELAPTLDDDPGILHSYLASIPDLFADAVGDAAENAADKTHSSSAAVEISTDNAADYTPTADDRRLADGSEEGTTKARPRIAISTLLRAAEDLEERIPLIDERVRVWELLGYGSVVFTCGTSGLPSEKASDRAGKVSSETILPHTENSGEKARESNHSSESTNGRVKADTAAGTSLELVEKGAPGDQASTTSPSDPDNIWKRHRDPISLSDIRSWILGRASLQAILRLPEGLTLDGSETDDIRAKEEEEVIAKPNSAKSSAASGRNCAYTTISSGLRESEVVVGTSGSDFDSEDHPTSPTPATPSSPTLPIPIPRQWRGRVLRWTNHVLALTRLRVSARSGHGIGSSPTWWIVVTSLSISVAVLAILVARTRSDPSAWGISWLQRASAHAYRREVGAWGIAWMKQFYQKDWGPRLVSSLGLASRMGQQRIE